MSYATPGLAAYMAELEARLAQAVGRRDGYASVVASEALAAGGKRLRPLLCFLSSDGHESEVLLAAGVATELVHMATLVHDDLVDGARMRRGVPAAWSVFGPGAALSAGDYLFACAFAELAASEDSQAVEILADACLALARGEAMQRRQTRRPETTIDDYLERCALKTGKLFEAACSLGSGGDPELGAYGLALGIAFQIADDILDCAGPDPGDREDPGHRSARGDADDAAPPRGGAGRRRPQRARRRAARRARSSGSPAPTRSSARARRRSTTRRRRAPASARRRTARSSRP